MDVSKYAILTELRLHHILFMIFCIVTILFPKIVARKSFFNVNDRYLVLMYASEGHLLTLYYDMGCRRKIYQQIRNGMLLYSFLSQLKVNILSYFKLQIRFTRDLRSKPINEYKYIKP